MGSGIYCQSMNSVKKSMDKILEKFTPYSISNKYFSFWWSIKWEPLTLKLILFFFSEIDWPNFQTWSSSMLKKKNLRIFSFPMFGHWLKINCKYFFLIQLCFKIYSKRTLAFQEFLQAAKKLDNCTRSSFHYATLLGLDPVSIGQKSNKEALLEYVCKYKYLRSETLQSS